VRIDKTYLNFLAEGIVEIELARMHYLAILRANRNMDVCSTSGIVAREDSVEVDGAKDGRRLPATQRSSVDRVVVTDSIGLPGIDTGIVNRLAGRYIDDLHGETEIDTLGSSADVLTLQLTVEPEGAIDGLGSQGTTGNVLVRVFLVPAELPQVLGVWALAVVLVVLASPVLDIFFA
jgi:hypothetical protein